MVWTLHGAGQTIKGLVGKQVQVKFDTGCFLTVGMVTCYTDRPRCSGRILVTVTLEQQGICKSTKAPSTICSAGDGYCAPPPHPLHCPHCLLNKSFLSLNPVRMENDSYRVGCFFKWVKWWWVNGAFWDLIGKNGYLAGQGNKHCDTFAWLLLYISTDG